MHCDLMRPSLSASASRNISSSTFCNHKCDGIAREDDRRQFAAAQRDMFYAPRSLLCTALQTPCTALLSKQQAAAAARHLSRSSLVM
jgi:hypothetical protein